MKGYALVGAFVLAAFGCDHRAVNKNQVELEAPLVVRLGNVRVGVGDGYRGAYRSEDGQEHVGIVMPLSPFGGDAKQEKIVIGDGSRFDVGGSKWRAIDVGLRRSIVERIDPP